MFGSRRRGTVIAEGLKIVGNVTAEGLVEVNGQIEGRTALHFAHYLSQSPCRRRCSSRASGCGR